MQQKDIAFEKIIDELKSDIKKLKESRVSQTAIIPGAVKMRAMSEANRWFRSGLDADLPNEGENATDSSAAYYAKDTNKLYVWDGSAWNSKTISDNDSVYPGLSKAVNRQDNTTNSIVSNQLIQSGWGWKLGDSATTIMSEAVTFPVAFDVAPIVVCNAIGTAASDPVLISDLSTTNIYTTWTSQAITTSGFTAYSARYSNDGNSPGNYGATTRYGYSWIAIGTKSR